MRRTLYVLATVLAMVFVANGVAAAQDRCEQGREYASLAIQIYGNVPDVLTMLDEYAGTGTHDTAILLAVEMAKAAEDTFNLISPERAGSLFWKPYMIETYSTIRIAALFFELGRAFPEHGNALEEVFTKTVEAATRLTEGLVDRWLTEWATQGCGAWSGFSD